ncbi:MAG: hypothetical protein KUA35_05855 [Pseudodesulfovibrio sp.]|uniref:Uncharacterized protein n=1 Tax=Pseudodesulfovibrio aespoeensis (strain ATCC 700646 / DSM 10631 / Aspo-2) TaxID=643562 RepID=E6VYN9_PSEA9|nr:MULTISPECIES: hypothetical protein [Pseudodesulfovibrio]MBU4192653.1 hypothetical protein [Pseudomonadota bacterium]ADU63906.1 hypothetical protein Daes_2912 [Pseudodesulfovibrio aespoeensis Aspo-2]MBU4243585.1 hypothetical protein [Pseudomonadota bacterium]MBU4378240.1 hypothetical protein [Pseudomonadota bacterium]MBU4475427.1 hypothetical protein [Pseudomonadota bacterium]
MRNMLVYAAVLGIMLQMGCSPLTRHEESAAPFGASVRQALNQQILNPEAGTDAPVVGLDGRYAAKVGTTYQEGPKTDSSEGQSVSEIIIQGR